LFRVRTEKMSLRFLKNLVQLVILLITIECVTPVFSSFSSNPQAQISFTSKKDHHSLVGTVSFAKAEEQRVEEEHDKFAPVILADFTRIAILLAGEHTPRIHLRSFKNRFISHPALFKLYNVFLI
jgi:hypothetical protein